MATHIRAYDRNKNALGLMPDYQSLMEQVQLNDHGVLTFLYAPNGTNVSFLDNDVLYLSLLVDGVEREERYVLDDDADNTAAVNASGLMVKVNARGVLANLENAEVYPAAHTPGGPVTGMELEHKFTNATPGAMFVELIRRAKNRGAIPEIEVGFTATHDSAGVAWPSQYTVTYAAGMKYLEILRAACDNGWMDMRMKGFELQLFVPNGTLAQDKSSSVVIRNAQQVQNGPRKRSRRGIVTAMLGLGSEKNAVYVGDPAAEARFGRREGHASDGRMTENGSLLAMTQHELEARKKAQEGFKLTLSLPTAAVVDPVTREQWVMPFRDFKVGDKIAWDRLRVSDTAFEPLRVRSISLSWVTPDAPPSCEVELNDQFVERTLKLERQVQGIVQGSVTAAPPPTTDPGQDVTVPKSPPALSASPSVYAVAGTHRVSVAVSWSATTENQDGSEYADHDHYLVGWSTDRGTSWSPDSQVSEPFTWISDLTPGSPLDVRVKTRDSSGNESAYTVFSVGTLPVDDVPPPRPSAPLVSTTLGVSTISWDGLGHDGVSMPPDFQQVVCYTEGAEGTTTIEEYRGRWIQRGWAIAGGGTPTGGELHLYAVTIADGTDQAVVLSSPAGAPWGPVKVSLRSLSSTQALRIDVAGAVTTVNLGGAAGVPLGGAFNLHLRAHRGRLVATVNQTQVADVALPAGADYFLTNPVGVTGITATEASVDLLTYYPAGHPKRVGTLGHDAAPSLLTIAGQEYERAYTVWFVAEDRDGNRSDPSVPTSFASKPLVDADLIGTTVRDALAEANNQLATIPGELEALNRDVEAARASADGKNTMHYGPAAPSGTAHRVGDTWFDSANGFRINRWSGTAWVPSLLAGTAMQDASITADKVLIGGANLLPDPYFAVRRAWANSSLIQPDGGRLSGGSLLIPQSTSQAGAYIANVWSDTPYAVPVVEDKRYRVGAWVRFEGAAPTAANRASLYAKFWDPLSGTGGAFTSPTLVAQSPAGVPADTWTWIEGTVAIPAGRTLLSIGCYKQSGHTVGAVRFDGVVVQPMADGSLIVDGAITASKILAGTITAESGIIGSLDAGKITVGELDGTRIKAGTIAAEKLLIGRADNLVPNGAGEAQSNLGWGSPPWGLTWDTADKPAVVPGSFRSQPGQGSINLTTAQNSSIWFDVQPWGEYLFEVWFKADKPGSRIYLELRDQSGAHAIGSSRRDPSDQYSLDPGAAPYLVTNLPLETEWVRYSRVITMSPTATRVRLGTVYLNHVNGTERGAVQWIAGVRIRPTTPGILLADGAITAGKVAARAITSDAIAAGAITADKIKAGEITADKLAANAITADKIKAGAIDGQTITGAIFRTNSTDWRMQLDDGGLRATDSSPGGVGAMSLTRSGIDAAVGDFDTLSARTFTVRSGIREEVDLTQYGTSPNSYYSDGFGHEAKRSYMPTSGAGIAVRTFAQPTGGGRTDLMIRSQGTTADSIAQGVVGVKGKGATLTDTGPALHLDAPRLNGGTGGGTGAKGLVVLEAWDVVAATYTNRSGATGVDYRSILRGGDWIPLNLEPSWAQYSANPSAGWAAPAYKIVGFRVFLRGLIMWKATSNPAGSTEGEIIARGLPGPGSAGMEIFGTAGQQGYTEVQVFGSGYAKAEYRNCLVHRKGLVANGGSAFLSLSGIGWHLE